MSTKQLKAVLETKEKARQEAVDQANLMTARVNDALKELDSYCDGCSRFKSGKCILKKAWSCQILKIRMILAGDETQK